MSFTYAYITGCLILSVIWLWIFLQRRDLRKELLWTSFCGLPLGFIDFFLVPTYWHPASLFNLIERYGVGIESFLFLFLMSGIASVIYDFLTRRKTVRMGHAKHGHVWLLIFVPAMFVITSLKFPMMAIYNLMIVGAVGAAITAYQRPDLKKQMLATSIIFTFLYLCIFVLMNQIFPNMVSHFYNLKHMWGILILGVPLEEVAVAFFAGAFWSTIYEYTKVYREKRV